MFSPRIALKPLVGLCRRLSTTIEAGIDMRTVWSREADRAHGHLQRHLRTIAEAVNRGETLADALVATDDFFPALFREMVELGEHTGRVDAVLAQLAEHYETQAAMRRTFWAAIIWPLVQLGLAVLIVGFLIWITGVIRDATGSQAIDILGFGLVGNRGLAIYATIVGGLGLLVWLTVRAVRRGLVWTQPIQRVALRLPGIGKPLQTIALARLAWSMHVTVNAGMDIRRALKLSLRSTQNARYIDNIPAIDAEISSGNSIYEAFCRTGNYPIDFLDTLAVGEESGELDESMRHLARQYQQQARAAMAALTILAGWAIWAAIAALIIALIFRVFSFYLGAISGAI